MAKKAASKAKKTPPRKKPATKAAEQQTVARLTYTAELEVMTLIHIMPGHTPAAVLEAIRSGKADFAHDSGQIEINDTVVATLARPHLLKDEYDDFEIEPL